MPAQDPKDPEGAGPPVQGPSTQAEKEKDDFSRQAAGGNPEGIPGAK